MNASHAIAIEGGPLFDPGASVDRESTLVVVDGVVVDGPAPAGAERIDARGCLVTPAFTDLHVHLREPGGEESETIATGTASALAGGFATVYAMPNTRPTADSPEVLERVRDAAARAGPCEVVPVSAITKGLGGRELVDFEAQARAGATAFSDDGSWPADERLAEEAFRRIAAGGWLLMQHCEDFAITGSGVLHAAPATRAAHLPGIPRAAEDHATSRDIGLAGAHGTRLHLCHVSTAGSVESLRAAKRLGLRVSGEVTPHHLVLTVDDAIRGGADFKMKPPLRQAADVEVLVAALEHGTIDAIGTDHAPHADALKSAGLAKAPFGAIGLETAFPVLYTRLVLAGRLSLGRLVEALTVGPARVAGRAPATLVPGAPARVAILDLETERIVDRNRLRSRSHNCPFHGMRLAGWARAVVIGGRVAFLAKEAAVA